MDLFDDLHLVVLQNVSFQLNGAPAHYGGNVQNHLHEIFPKP